MICIRWQRLGQRSEGRWNRVHSMCDGRWIEGGWGNTSCGWRQGASRALEIGTMWGAGVCAFGSAYLTL